MTEIRILMCRAHPRGKLQYRDQSWLDPNNGWIDVPVVWDEPEEDAIGAPECSEWLVGKIKAIEEIDYDDNA